MVAVIIILIPFISFRKIY